MDGGFKLGSSYGENLKSIKIIIKWESTIKNLKIKTNSQLRIKYK